jgi:hypothetical protein
MIGDGHTWAWVDGIAAGLERNTPPMHDVIDRRVRVSARLSPQSNRCAR